MTTRMTWNYVYKSVHIVKKTMQQLKFGVL